MKRQQDGTIALTQEEIDDLTSFITSSLHRAWDQHTNTFICENTSWEDGMRRMDPRMYDMAIALQAL